MEQLTFITGNPEKAIQVGKYLNQPIKHEKLDLTEIQSLDVAEVVTHKVTEAYRMVNKPVLVDDTALIIAALGKLPGPFIKYFIAELGPKKICEIIQQFDDKSAMAIVVMGLHDGTQVRVFTGTVTGSIAKFPSGTGGFGWDSIFIPDGYDTPRATFTESDYDATSPRKKALDELHYYLMR